MFANIDRFNRRRDLKFARRQKQIKRDTLSWRKGAKTSCLQDVKSKVATTPQHHVTKTPSFPDAKTLSLQNSKLQVTTVKHDLTCHVSAKIAKTLSSQAAKNKSSATPRHEATTPTHHITKTPSFPDAKTLSLQNSKFQVTTLKHDLKCHVLAKIANSVDV